jgi:predicted TIM-barrel fold metal-dependent hydrolase
VTVHLDHPIIDGDGHVIEYMPAVLPYLREQLDSGLFERYVGGDFAGVLAMPPLTMTERVANRLPQEGWWGMPTRNTLDRATCMLPALLHERMPEIGVDFTVLYPTMGFGIAGHNDPDLRGGLCRGFNQYFADTYGPYGDRMTVAGVIPMHNPEEAIAELHHCQDIGLKVVAIPHGVIRPIPKPVTGHPSPYVMPGRTHWFDTYGLDSLYDYDPVWQCFSDLGFAVTIHGGLTIDPNIFSSISNFMFNHLGFHAGNMFPICKSLFLGGVTARFPDVPFAFLECGIGWAAVLLADLVEHWERRKVDVLDAVDPANLDVARLEALFAQYGPEPMKAAAAASGGLGDLKALGGPAPENLDEWRHLHLERSEQIGELFVRSFFFGVEAEDRSLAFGFSRANAFGSRLQAIFSSDMGHWDVEDIGGIVPSAFGLVEAGVITEDDFRDFTFANPARLYLRRNPDFFKGTAVESQVESLVKAPTAR